MADADLDMKDVKEITNMMSQHQIKTREERKHLTHADLPLPTTYISQIQKHVTTQSSNVLAPFLSSSSSSSEKKAAAALPSDQKLSFHVNVNQNQNQNQKINGFIVLHNPQLLQNSLTKQEIEYPSGVHRCYNCLAEIKVGVYGCFGICFEPVARSESFLAFQFQPVTHHYPSCVLRTMCDKKVTPAQKALFFEVYGDSYVVAPPRSLLFLLDGGLTMEQYWLKIKNQITIIEEPSHPERIKEVMIRSLPAPMFFTTDMTKTCQDPSEIKYLVNQMDQQLEEKDTLAKINIVDSSHQSYSSYPSNHENQQQQQQSFSSMMPLKVLPTPSLFPSAATHENHLPIHPLSRDVRISFDKPGVENDVD
jgi:hypothetical protein